VWPPTEEQVAENLLLGSVAGAVPVPSLLFCTVLTNEHLPLADED
jgi:hypothetical protein